MRIISLNVKNYRSLENVSIGDLKQLVTLYGNNDTGKSNILSFLEILFQSKHRSEVFGISEEDENPIIRETPSGFWKGTIDNFSKDNYFNNNIDDPIDFTVVINFDHKEIVNIEGIPTDFIEELHKNKKSHILDISGVISHVRDQIAEIDLRSANFDQIEFYKEDKNEKPVYLPGFSVIDDEKFDVFDLIMSKLDDAFVRVPTARFIKSEYEIDRSETVDLIPSKFKNWLFRISIDRNLNYIFKRLSEQFSDEPFSYGDLSLARTGTDEIELFVENDDGIKVPFSQKGTGVQQILMILAYVLSNNSPIIGIEEMEINLDPRSQLKVFKILFDLVYNDKNSIINQVFLTTHSPYIAKRDQASRRGVWIEKNKTVVKKPSEAKVNEFFEMP